MFLPGALSWLRYFAPLFRKAIQYPQNVLEKLFLICFLRSRRTLAILLQGTQKQLGVSALIGYAFSSWTGARFHVFRDRRLARENVATYGKVSGQVCSGSLFAHVQLLMRVSR